MSSLPPTSFDHSCPQYLDSSIQDRIHHVQSLHLCFNCLGQSHLKKNCPSSNRCFKPNCGALHHTSLHNSDSENKRPNVKKTYPNKPQPAPASTHAPKTAPTPQMLPQQFKKVLTTTLANISSTPHSSMLPQVLTQRKNSFRKRFLPYFKSFPCPCSMETKFLTLMP